MVWFVSHAINLLCFTRKSESRQKYPHAIGVDARLEVGEANKVVLDVDIDDDGKGCEASGFNYIHDQIECRQVLQCFHISCMSPKKVW